MPPVRRFVAVKKIVGEWDWNKKCVVCLIEVRLGEEVIACPACGAIGHKGHFLEWLKVKAVCPNCKRPLRESDLERSWEVLT